MRSPILALSLISTLTLSPAVLAFVGTSPLVAWSSDSTLSGLQSLEQAVEAKGPIVSASSVFDELLSGDELCGLKGVLVISQESLHASDLRSTPLLSPFLKTSSLSIPYVASGSVDRLEASIQSLSRSCGARVDTLKAGESITDLKPLEMDRSMRLVQVMAKREEIEGESRETMLAWEDALLAPMVKSFLEAYPDSHLVVLTGHPAVGEMAAVQAERRQESTLEVPSEDYSNLVAPFKGNGNHSTGEKTALLARYDITSTSILTMLGVSFGILIPILGFGIMALTSVSVPPRMDNVKGIQTVTADKKNQ
ncbi:hypothetical protein [Phaffia rhodozyma]|uniref:Protein BIG1 n=1 Tax=Phaffia rhodozyma TaxID=264483 RepID=A0A0F7SST0_PHARH|nr:hypothetical protein [Phaffia rhodozyma]